MGRQLPRSCEPMNPRAASSDAGPQLDQGDLHGNWRSRPRRPQSSLRRRRLPRWPPRRSLLPKVCRRRQQRRSPRPRRSQRGAQRKAMTKRLSCRRLRPRRSQKAHDQEAAKKPAAKKAAKSRRRRGAIACRLRLTPPDALSRKPPARSRRAASLREEATRLMGPRKRGPGTAGFVEFPHPAHPPALAATERKRPVMTAALPAPCIHCRCSARQGAATNYAVGDDRLLMVAKATA